MCSTSRNSMHLYFIISLISSLWKIEILIINNTTYESDVFLHSFQWIEFFSIVTLFRRIVLVDPFRKYQKFQFIMKCRKWYFKKATKILISNTKNLPKIHSILDWIRNSLTLFGLVWLGLNWYKLELQTNARVNYNWNALQNLRLS